MFDFAYIMAAVHSANAVHDHQRAERERARTLRRQEEFARAGHNRRMEMLAEDQIEATNKLAEEIRKKNVTTNHYHEHRHTNLHY